MSTELPWIAHQMYSGYKVQTDVNAIQTIVKYKWVGIPDLRKPNTKRPTYIKKKFVSYKYPIYVFEASRAIVMHPSILAEVERRMMVSVTKRLHDEIEASFFGSNVNPSTFTKKSAVFDQEAYNKMLSLLPPGPNIYDGLLKSRFYRGTVEDSVDAIRYALRLRFDRGVDS